MIIISPSKSYSIENILKWIFIGSNIEVIQSNDKFKWEKNKNYISFIFILVGRNKNQELNSWAW